MSTSGHRGQFPAWTRLGLCFGWSHTAYVRCRPRRAGSLHGPIAPALSASCLRTTPSIICISLMLGDCNRSYVVYRNSSWACPTTAPAKQASANASSVGGDEPCAADCGSANTTQRTAAYSTSPSPCANGTARQCRCSGPSGAHRWPNWWTNHWRPPGGVDTGTKGSALPRWLEGDGQGESWFYLQISGDAIASSYLVALTRLFLEAKLQGQDHQAAKESANARAYEMETLCITPLAEHLRDLFHTDDEVQFDAFGKEWKQLQTLEFWQFAIMQEVSQVRRHIEKHQKNENPPNYTIEGVLHFQPR